MLREPRELVGRTLDRPAQVVRGSGLASETFTYTDASNTVTTQRDKAATYDKLIKTEVVYDGLGRESESRQYEDSRYILRRKTYGAMGRLAQESNPYRSGGTAYWTKYEYDGLGRLKTVTTPDLAPTTTTYLGNQTTVTDPAQVTSRLMIRTKAIRNDLPGTSN